MLCVQKKDNAMECVVQKGIPVAMMKKGPRGVVLKIINVVMRRFQMVIARLMGDVVPKELKLLSHRPTLLQIAFMDMGLGMQAHSAVP